MVYPQCTSVTVNREGQQATVNWLTINTVDCWSGVDQWPTVNREGQQSTVKDDWQSTLLSVDLVGSTVLIIDLPLIHPWCWLLICPWSTVHCWSLICPKSMINIVNCWSQGDQQCWLLICPWSTVDCWSLICPWSTVDYWSLICPWSTVDCWLSIPHPWLDDPHFLSKNW